MYFFQNKDNKKALDEIQIGIGDLSRSTGVSTRQLRYWEEKGYIKSLDNEDSSVRKYSIAEYYHVRIIKLFLSEGYTLNSAVEKAEIRRQQLQMLRRFGMEIIKNVEITDSEHNYGKIDLGLVYNNKQKHAYGVVDEKGCSIEIEEVDVNET